MALSKGCEYIHVTSSRLISGTEMQRGLNYHWAAIAGSVCFTKLKFSVIIKLSFFSCSNISLFAVSLVMFVLPSVLPCINITCNFGNIKSLAFHIISRRKFHMLQES